MESATHWPTPKKHSEAFCKPMGPSFCWANFHKVVIYGYAGWPSYCEWIVPGTITNEEMM